MADRRSISPGLLAHPVFRRASLVAREVWLGLILMADDEGRVRLDMVAMAEAIFSPLTHKVTEKKMQEALTFWATAHDNGKPPWLLVYGSPDTTTHDGNGAGEDARNSEDTNSHDGKCLTSQKTHRGMCAGQYGFLTGWYEHQLIRDELREESSLPAPPVPVNSWRAADAIYRWYCRDKKQKKTYTRLAIRALSSLTVEQQCAIVAEELCNSYTTVAQKLPVGVKGGEGKGGEGEDDPDFCGESFDPVIQASRAYFTTPNPPLLPPDKALAYGRECRAQLQGNSDFTDEQICEAFRSNGPRSGNERTFCGNWFERLRRERVDVGSDDPVVAAFIRKTGQKRPDDPFGIAKWDTDLTAFRAAQEVPA